MKILRIPLWHEILLRNLVFKRLKYFLKVLFGSNITFWILGPVKMAQRIGACVLNLGSLFHLWHGVVLKALLGTVPELNCQMWTPTPQIIIKQNGSSFIVIWYNYFTSGYILKMGSNGIHRATSIVAWIKIAKCQKQSSCL